jgi:hypothetical protein
MLVRLGTYRSFSREPESMTNDIELFAGATISSANLVNFPIFNCHTFRYRRDTMTRIAISLMWFVYVMEDREVQDLGVTLYLIFRFIEM